MFGQFLRKNSASALERIWLQCCLPSHLNCWLEDLEAAGEDEKPERKEEGVNCWFEITGEEEKPDVIDPGILIPPLRYADSNMIRNPKTCVLNGPFASCQ